MRMPNIPGPKGPQADPETCVGEDVGNSFWSYGTTAPATGSGPPTQAVSCIALPKARIGELKKIKCEVSQQQHVPHRCISWGLRGSAVGTRNGRRWLTPLPVILTSA